MQLFLDLHCHSRFSADGVAEPEDLIREAKEKGLQGFAITDHNTCACVDYFMQHGYMNKEGLPVDGLLIIPGQEITTADGHLLALGITLPDLKGIPALEAVSLIHQAGGLAIPPHPYDFFRAGIREPVLETLEIDALEVFNAATTLKRYNKQAFQYAQGRGLPMTASSDAHDSAALGTAYSILEAETFSVEGVLNAIRKGPTLRQRYLTPANALKKTWNNVFRLRRKRAPKAEEVS
jgi:predicted metal-dependent phosphoesterase TrpH